MDVFKRFAREFLALAGDLPSLVIGFSGGADSVFLLTMLAQLYNKDSLLAVHVNHGLRSPDESMVDEDFCRRFCLERGLSFKAVKLNPPHQDKSLISEEWLRDERYRVLTETAKEAKISYVVCAHHRDDQAETVLFRLLRGTGSAGAAAMRSRRALSDDVFLLRPLLTFSRAEIEETLKSFDIRYVTDSSNSECKYKRNFLRQAVFPLIESEQGFPAARKNLADFAASLAEDNELLDKLAEEAFAEVFVYGRQGVALKLAQYEKLHQALKVRVCREFCRLHQLPFERALFQRLVSLFRGESDRQELLQGFSAVKDGELVSIVSNLVLDYDDKDVELIEKKMQPVTLAAPLTGSVVKIIPWLSFALRLEAFEEGNGPEGRQIAALKKSGDLPLFVEFVDLSSLFVTPDFARELTFRPRRGGDKFCPLGGQETTLKRYLHGQGGGASARWLRFLENCPGFSALSDNRSLLLRLVPVLAKGEKVLWLPGFAPSSAIAVAAGGRASHRLELLPLSHHLEKYDDNGTKTC